MKNLSAILSVGVAALMGFTIGYWVSSKTANLPQGAVVAFTAETGCPEGWREYEPAKGRFIYGHSDELGSGGVGETGSLDFGGGSTDEFEGRFEDKEVIDPDILNTEPPMSTEQKLPYVVLRHCVN